MKSEREKYKESFENLLKDRAFLYDYDFGANSSSADRVCIDRYLLWLLLEKKRVDEYNQLLEMEVIDRFIKSVAEAPEEYIYKVGSEEQAVEALNKTGLDGSLVITDFVEELNEEYRLFLIKHAGKIEFLLCLKKQRTDSTLTEEFEIATNIFRMLDLNFGYIEIARNDKGYLVMETNSRPLVKLFEYCTKIESEKYAKL
ncbi:17109_t:CDS:2, partial [Racocetra persica]